MNPARLPLTELLTSVFDRLDGNVGTKFVAPEEEIPVFSFVPPAHDLPYLEIGDFSWLDTLIKNAPGKEVVVQFNAYSRDATMKEVNAIVNAAVHALTGDPVPSIANGFRIWDVRLDGSGEVRKEQLEETVFWRGTFRVRFRVQDLTAASAGS